MRASKRLAAPRITVLDTTDEPYEHDDQQLAHWQDPYISEDEEIEYERFVHIDFLILINTDMLPSDTSSNAKVSMMTMRLVLVPRIS